MPNLYDPVDVLTNAILGQESDWNPNAPTSVTGARGIGQIQPGTWKAYAYPGENIDNATDNAAVARRIIESGYKKYGFDPGRIATEYFSGPGNVSPKNSTVPFIQNKTDPTGKSTASYVSDINRRVGRLAESSQPVSANDILSSFESATGKSKADNSVTGEDILSQFNAVAKQVPQTAAPQQAANIPIPTESMTPAQLQEYQAGLQRGKQGITTTEKLGDLAGGVWDSIKSGWKATTEAYAAPKWMPTFETKKTTITDIFGNQRQVETPGINEPGKILGTLGGIGQITSAPIANPLERLTGNKEFGERAAMLVPGLKLGTMAKAASPAVRALTDIVKSVPETYLPEAISALERNPTLSLVDVSKTARERADTIGADRLAPQAQQKIFDFIGQRGKGRPGELAEAVDLLGKLPDPYTVVNNLRSMPSKVWDNVVGPIVEKSKPADVTDVINSIDKEIASASTRTLSPYQNELVDLRDKIRGSWKNRDTMLSTVNGENGLNKIQSDLRVTAQNLLGSTGSDRNVGYKLMQVRQKLVDAIDANNPGYKSGLEQYRHAQEALDAFDRGSSINQKGKLTIEGISEDSPEAWKKWAQDKKTNPDTINAAKLGALTWMRNELEGMKTGKKLMESPKDPQLVGKIGALFGDTAAEDFTNAMRDIHRKAQTVQALNPNSATFARIRGAEASPIRVPGAKPAGGGLNLLYPAIAGAAVEMAHPGFEAGVIGPAISALAIGAKAGKALKETYQYKSDLARRLEEANTLTRPISEQPQLLNLLRARRDAVGVGQKGLNALTSPLFNILPR